METRPPTVTRILVAIGFALSCFAPGAVPVDRLRRPAAAEAGGLSLHGPVQGGDPARAGVRRADLGRLGRQGEVDRAWTTTGSPTRRSRSTARTRRFPTDTRAILRQKTLLGETYVELTPGAEDGPIAARRAATCRRRRSPRRSSSTRSSAPSTPAPAQAFKAWMQGSAAALNGRGPGPLGRDRRARPVRRADQPRRCGCSTASSTRSRELIRSGGDVFQALSERQGQLRGLIENSNAVFQTTARRNADLEQTFQILPDFPARVARDARPPGQLRRQHRPAGPAASAGGASTQPHPDRGRKVGAGPRAVLLRPAGHDQARGHRLPGAPQAVERRPHTAPRAARLLCRRSRRLPGPPESDLRCPRYVQARGGRLRRQRIVGDQQRPAGVPGRATRTSSCCAPPAPSIRRPLLRSGSS